MRGRRDRRRHELASVPPGTPSSPTPARWMSPVSTTSARPARLRQQPVAGRPVAVPLVVVEDPPVGQAQVGQHGLLADTVHVARRRRELLARPTPPASAPSIVRAGSAPPGHGGPTSSVRRRTAWSLRYWRPSSRIRSPAGRRRDAAVDRVVVGAVVGRRRAAPACAPTTPGRRRRDGRRSLPLGRVLRARARRSCSRPRGRPRSPATGTPPATPAGRGRRGTARSGRGSRRGRSARGRRGTARARRRSALAAPS